MAGRMYERFHVAVPLEPTTLNNTNATGRYVPVARCKRVIAVLNSGAAAFEKTAKLEIMQAKTVVGGSAEAITGATATGVANTKVKKATITLTSAADTDTVTFNGTVYTRAASGANTFANAAALVAIINALGGYVASAASEVITVYAHDGYSMTIVGGSVAGTVAIATLQQVIIVEITDGQINTAGGFLYIAPKVTVTGNGYQDVVFLMEMKDLPDSQGNFSANYPA